VWHWVQLWRQGWLVRRPRASWPWQLSQRLRISVGCGICGGAPGHARGPAPADSNPTKLLSIAIGPAGGGAPGTGPSDTTWH
jgi:hypothetical protein